MHLKLEEQIKRGLESKTFSDIEKAGIHGLSRPEQIEFRNEGVHGKVPES